MNADGAARLAEAHLGRARRALRDGDEIAAVVWSNYCAEAAIERLATSMGIDTRKDHFRRASIARRLHEMQVLPHDLADLLIRLNNERKYALHEGKAPDMRGREWREILTRLEELVAVAGSAVTPPAGGAR